MFEFKVVDVTPKESIKEHRDTSYYISKLKNIRINKDNHVFLVHKTRLNNFRHSNRLFKRLYQHTLIVPKKFKWLVGGNIISNKNTIEFKHKLYLIYDFRAQLRQARQNLKLYKNDYRSVKESSYVSKYKLYDFLDLDNQKISSVRNKPNFYTRAINLKRVRNWFQNKKPLNKNNHVGIEIECYMNISREEFVKILNFEVPDLINNVTIKDDGSLHACDDNYSFEICIIAEENKINKIVKQIIDIAKRFDLCIDQRCGVHVHLDMRNRPREESLTNLTRFQNLMYKMTDKSRRKNKYCKPIRVLDANSYIWKIRRSRNSDIRYKGINVLSLYQHETYEIRIHAGCIDSERLTSWISLLVKIIDAKDVPKKVSTSAKKVATLLKLDNNLLQYVQKYSKVIRKTINTVPMAC
jgi:hypothetical protein